MKPSHFDSIVRFGGRLEIPPGAPPLLDIMIVESNPAEARLIAEAFRDAGLTSKIQQFHDGEDALTHLYSEGLRSDSLLPDLIFLDLSLPRKSGFEILEEIRSNTTLECIPVIILSGSANPADVHKAYRLRATCYIRKPNDLDEFMNVIQTCYQFWGNIVSLPPKTND
jgi:two-component system, chemotaxis family, response regulator Rcp1